MGGDDLGDSSGQEVPDDNPAIVTADSEERAVPVKGAGDGHGDAVQGPIELLRIILSEGLKKL